jgi:hypothetical protein
MDKSSMNNQRNESSRYEPEPDYLTDEEQPEDVEESDDRGICARIFCCCFKKKSRKNTRKYESKTRGLKIQSLEAMAGR